MHCFRRFRASVLRKHRCPTDLAKFWMGDALRDITEEYAEQLYEDTHWKREVAAAIGLGFTIPAKLYQQSVPYIHQQSVIAPNAAAETRSQFSCKPMKLGKEMVRPERFELPTFWFVARRSIQLS
jgi:hypothetical protein